MLLGAKVRGNERSSYLTTALDEAKSFPVLVDFSICVYYVFFYTRCFTVQICLVRKVSSIVHCFDSTISVFSTIGFCVD